MSDDEFEKKESVLKTHAIVLKFEGSYESCQET